MLMHLEFFLQISNFMKIPSVEAELFHADGRTDRYDESPIKPISDKSSKTPCVTAISAKFATQVRGSSDRVV
jgi:hypothetical protein